MLRRLPSPPSSVPGADLHQVEEGVAAQGRVLDHAAVVVGADLVRAGVHDRGLPHDGDLLLELAHLHADALVELLAQAHADARPRDGLEPGEAEADLVHPGRQVQDVVHALLVRQRGLRSHHVGAGDGHRHAREHRTGRILDDSRDAPGRALSERGHTKSGEESGEGQLPEHGRLLSARNLIAVNWAQYSVGKLNVCPARCASVQRLYGCCR